MDSTTLHAELANDPAGLGYAALVAVANDAAVAANEHAVHAR